jgi:esterase/lipase/1-acyl-sn-glycerol-3-phosphate acyltransferase
MNRSAYLTTSLAIKLLSRLSKADIAVHGKENIPAGPTIFVMNHFTRVETFLLPYYISNLTGKPAWSLAASSLFKGGLEKFFDLVGVVSTSDPKRDELIVKSLLTGEANWIIFPEGSMVKTKKIVDDGRYMVAGASGVHEPHTGAAALALKAELYRSHLLDTAGKTPDRLQGMLDALEIESPENIVPEQTTVQPVNLTYYPIRAAENFASSLAAKMVKDIPERMVEEIMIEGTMLLSGVDLDIRFGKPIQMADYLDDQWLQEDMARDGITGYSVSSGLKDRMRKTAYDIMQQYMHDIYAMTTVNHEHLFASLLRSHPFRRIEEIDFKRRVFYGASLISQNEDGEENFFLHKSLKEDQGHLLTDDRFQKYENFLELALEKGVVEKYGGYLIRDRSRIADALSFHKIRIDDPIEVMANEVEPLEKFQSIVRSLSWRPTTLLKFCLIRYLLKRENNRYQEDCDKVDQSGEEKRVTGGKPLFLPSFSRRLGVVLIHSYLAVPEEVEALASYLRKRGVWVYAPRLPGHGTSAEDLSRRKYREWFEVVENSYVLMSCICDSVVVGGVAVGGNMALDLAGRVQDVAGVFAICSPFALRNYSTNFMPGRDVWNRILNRMKRGDRNDEFLEYAHGNPHVNYPKNPVAGVKEVGEYLESIEKRYGMITQPALVMQAENNPVVDPGGSKQLYDSIGSADKEFCLLNYDRHVLVNGDGTEKVFKKIGAFIRDL